MERQGSIVRRPMEIYINSANDDHLSITAYMQAVVKGDDGSIIGAARDSAPVQANKDQLEEHSAKIGGKNVSAADLIGALMKIIHKMDEDRQSPARAPQPQNEGRAQGSEEMRPRVVNPKPRVRRK